MKKLVFPFMFSLLVFSVHAQYIDPPSITRLHGVYARWQNVVSNNWYSDTVSLNFADTSMFCFNHNRMVFGSQWGVYITGYC